MISRHYNGASHSRSLHAYLAGILNELVLRKHGASERDIHLGILAGLLHDIAMPPFSDEGKLACPDELEEEDNIGFILERGSFDSLFSDYKVSRQDVVDAVHGKGLVGQLMNSNGIDIDKIAYLAFDISQTYGDLNRPKMKLSYPNEYLIPKFAIAGVAGESDMITFKREASALDTLAEQLYQDLWGEFEEFALDDPYPCDIWEDIEIRDGQIVYTSPDRVHRFLKIRALMFNKIYFAPENRARKVVFGEIFRQMWERGILAKDNMLEMGDIEFEQLYEQSGYDPLLFRHMGMLDFPIREIQVARREDVIDEVADKKGHVVKEWQPFNPAVRTLTVKDGQVVYFDEGYPELAQEIIDISERTRFTAVYLGVNEYLQ